MLNSRDIDRLRPDVAANCRAWLELCRAAGFWCWSPEPCGMTSISGIVMSRAPQPRRTPAFTESGPDWPSTSARTSRDRSIRMPRSFSGPESWGAGGL